MSESPDRQEDGSDSETTVSDSSSDKDSDSASDKGSEDDQVCLKSIKTQFFHFDIHSLQNIAALGVGPPPPREISYGKSC